MEAACCQILPMGLTMRPGQGRKREGSAASEKELTSTKQLENSQNQKVVSTLPGHNYTGPYNPLEDQLRYDPTTGEILEFYVNPTGKTDAIAAQHDVDYSVCGNDRNPGDFRRCKNKADRQNGKISGCYSLERKTVGSCFGTKRD